MPIAYVTAQKCLLLLFFIVIISFAQIMSMNELEYSGVFVISAGSGNNKGDDSACILLLTQFGKCGMFSL
jgi:hypothetical protein